LINLFITSSTGLTHHITCQSHTYTVQHQLRCSTLPFDFAGAVTGNDSASARTISPANDSRGEQESILTLDVVVSVELEVDVEY
jgi:hypothetical protein